eukprot:9268205-Lingulodinium_polyedra.AAC.1
MSIRPAWEAEGARATNACHLRSAASRFSSAGMAQHSACLGSSRRATPTVETGSTPGGAWLARAPPEWPAAEGAAAGPPR